MNKAVTRQVKATEARQQRTAMAGASVRIADSLFVVQIREERLDAGDVAVEQVLKKK